MLLYLIYINIDLKNSVVKSLGSKIEWINKALTNYIYIIKIQTITVGPTKVDLNTHDIRLGQIYFHLTLLIRYFVLTDEVLGDPGDKMANYTDFFPGWINALSFLSTASILP